MGHLIVRRKTLNFWDHLQDAQYHVRNKKENEMRIAPLLALISQGASVGQDASLKHEFRLFTGYRTPLAIAIDRDDYPAAEALLKAGAPATDNDAFFYAASRHTMAYAKLLSDFGADFSQKNSIGQNILHFAAARDNSALFCAVAKSSPEIIVSKNGKGETPFEEWDDGDNDTSLYFALWFCLEHGLLGVNFPIDGCPAYVFLYGVRSASWASDEDKDDVDLLIAKLASVGNLAAECKGRSVIDCAKQRFPEINDDHKDTTGQSLLERLGALIAKQEQQAITDGLLSSGTTPALEKENSRVRRI